MAQVAPLELGGEPTTIIYKQVAPTGAGCFFYTITAVPNKEGSTGSIPADSDVPTSL